MSGGSRGGAVDYFVSGSAADADGFPSVAGSPSIGSSSTRLRPNSDRRRANVFGSLTAAPLEPLRVGVVASAVRGEYGLPPNAITDSDDPFANRPVFERVDDVDGLSGHVAASFTPGGPVMMRSWAFVNQLDEHRSRYDDSTYSSMDDSTVRGTFRSDTRTRLTGASMQVIVSPRRFGQLTAGLTAERDAWDMDLVVRDVPVGGGGGRQGGSGRAATFDVRSVADARALHRYGAALEYAARPTRLTGVVIGYAHHWLDKDSAGGGDAGAGSVGAYLDLPTRTRIRGAAARTIRFPTIRQLYDADGGNPTLRTERANSAEIGLEQTLPGRTDVVLTAFRTDAKDFIERPGSGQPFENHDDYRFAGVEATVETRAVREMLLRGRYTYLDTEDRSPGADREALQYRPRHRGSVEARYAFPFGLTASAAVLRVADQVYYSRQEPIVARRLPDYTLATMRAEQALFGGRVSVYAGADNLLK